MLPHQDDRDLDYSILWGIAPDDLWAAGPLGAIAHWDGASWTEPAFPEPTVYELSIRAIWAPASDDLWIAGDYGLIQRWDGSRWRSLTTEYGQRAYGFWACDSQDLWLGGRGRVLRRRDGDWTAMPVGDDDVHLWALWGMAANDLWAVGTAGLAFHWDGTSWSRFETGAGVTLRALWGSGSDDLWAVGFEGSPPTCLPGGDLGGWIVHWDGAAWSVVLADHPTPVSSIWGSAPDDVWAAADSTLLHYDGSSWSPVAMPELFSATALAGCSADDLWATGRGTTWHWDGREWTELLPFASSAFVTTRRLNPLGDLGHRIQTADPRRFLHCRAGGDLWLADRAGVIRHWDGHEWISEELPIVTVHGLWSTATGEVWLSSERGLLQRASDPPPRAAPPGGADIPR